MQYNILVVDDEKEIGDAIEIYLKNEGMNVFKAKDGLECLKLIEDFEIHLILMDIMMPNLDGIRATQRIRELPNHCKTPVLALTANAFVGDRAHCLGQQRLRAFFATPGSSRCGRFSRA